MTVPTPDQQPFTPGAVPPGPAAAPPKRSRKAIIVAGVIGAVVGAGITAASMTPALTSAQDDADYYRDARDAALDREAPAAATVTETVTETVTAEPEPTSEAPEPTTTAAPEPAGPATSIGDGTWIVGDDVQPGTYKTDGGGDFCYWARLSGLSGELDDIIVNGAPTGPGFVTIDPSDMAFTSQGCGTWTLTE